jgi:membrane-associated protein
MDGLLQFFENYFPALIEHRYIFLFLGSLVEGLNTMVVGGFLVSVNSVKLLPTFFLFTLGYTLNGYIWYAVGYYAGAKPIDKWGRSKPKSERIILKVQEYFERYSGRAIVLTKFTFSLTIATLIMAGSLKYDMRKFSLYNFLGSIGWVAVTLFVGYFFGESYKFFFTYIKNFTYIIIFLGGAIALIYIIKWLFRTAFVRSLLFTDKIREFSYKIRDGLDRFLTNGDDDEDGVDGYHKSSQE